MLNAPMGIFGGTFNPIHHGHLRSALDICSVLSLDSIMLMPAFMSPHKTQQSIDTKHRLAMLESATQTCPLLTVSDFEINNPEISYTVNTIEYFREKYPSTPLCFLMGMDSFLQFTTWHRWQDILRNSHLVVSQRPGYILSDNSTVTTLLNNHQAMCARELQQSLGGLIYLHDAHPLAISSSGIRHLISQSQPITFLTPLSVENYISQHHLYSV